MKNIFADGEIVHSFQIPEEVIGDSFEKSVWGVEVLGDFISAFHGLESKQHVRPSRSSEGKLTGTKAIIVSKNISYTYMLVEPKKQKDPRFPEVHVSKLEEDLSKGGEVDYILHQFGDEGRKSRRPINNPFSQLEDLKKNLPKKRKRGFFKKIMRQ